MTIGAWCPPQGPPGLWAVLTATTLAVAGALLWGRPRRRASPLQPLALAAGDAAWRMANISVNPELLKRFGLPVPNEPAYPGLAEGILERRVPGGVRMKARACFFLLKGF